MPAAELRALAGGQADADSERIAAAKAVIDAGGELPGELVTDEDTDRGFAMVAKLVIGWRVYDATSTEDDQPLLGLPATTELVGRLPREILERVMEEVGKANPQPTSAGSTGKAS
jgi:hypothetical protein